MKKSTTTNDIEMIRMAILGHYTKMRELEVELARLTAHPVTIKKKQRRKNRLGPEALARIAAAQKKRWAAFHKKQAKRAA